MAFTLLELRQQIQSDLDLVASNGSISRGDPFLPPKEIDFHIRRAVLDATAIIHKLYEDYYLVPAKAINIVSGTDSYATPTDLYVNKIRRVLFNDGALKYVIKRITNITDIPVFQPNDELRYIIVNELGVGYRMKFYPTPSFTSATNVTMWYIRKSKELLLDTDILDIPEEFTNYVLANAKYRCLQKDIGNPMREEFKIERDEQKQLMMTVLSNKVPDDETDIRCDYSFYNNSIA
jgi:hypothetical protein